MALFQYKATTPEGEVDEGEMEAANEAAVIASLQDTGRIPIRVRAAGGFRLGGKSTRALKQSTVVNFTQELATLIGAGLPLDRSLQMLVELAENPRIEDVASRVLDKVRSGATLSDALEAQQGAFSRFYINMVRAGEMGGALETVLDRLADYLKRSKELRDSVITALIYPGILVTVSLISVTLLLALVVPQFTELFDDADKALPLPTQIVVAISDFMRQFWWVILLLIAGVVWYARHQFADIHRRVPLDRLMLKLPLFGSLITRLEVARFSRSLGTLLGNGVPLLSSLAIVKEILSNRVLAEGMEAATGSLKEGQGMATPLMESGLFPALGLQLIKVGEETGELESMLLRVADIYDGEVRSAINRMLSLLEPVLIVVLGVVVGGIIASVLMAILSVNELAL